MRDTYLTCDEAAEHVRLSSRQLKAKAMLRQVPHRRLPGSRKLLFSEAELAAWLDGAPLETVELGGYGRIVRPVEQVTA